MPPDSTATFKPRDVEELIDFYFHRRAANLVVRVLAPLPITPDQVTVASGLVALIAGGMIGWAGPRSWLVLAGAAVFMLSIVLDCADGQLARLRRVASLYGRALDGFVDVVSVASIIVAQFIWMDSAGVPLWLTLALGWGAGFSLRWHAHSYDHIKNTYLHNTEERHPGETPWLPSQEAIERERLESERQGRWFMVLVLRAFAAFTKVQRAGVKNQMGHDRPGTETAAEREAYRRRFRHYMRGWSFNGLGTHLFILTAATVFIPLVPTAPLWAWGIICGPMNLMTVLLERWRPRLEAQLREELAALTVGKTAARE